MRIDLSVLAAAGLCGGLATFEPDIARPGGAYATMPAESAQACAAACAEDTLCIAWTFEEACELKAVAPAPVSRAGAASGLSARAPAFTRLVAPQPAAAEAAEAAAAVLEAPALRAAFDLETIDAPQPQAPRSSDDSGLLGGPVAPAAPERSARLDDAAPAS